MGLPEWLTIIILIWVCYLYLVPKHRAFSVFLLGLVPFFRQNLLITVLILFGWVLAKNRQKVPMIILFALPLLLPVYHNLYYANEWRFFVDVFQVPFLQYDNQQKASGLNIPLLFSNVIHYLGLDYENGQFLFSPIAFIFLPLSTVMFFLFVKAMPTLFYKLFFVMITMSAVLPIILFGYAYFPRFEVVNVVVMLTTFLLLYPNQFNEVCTEFAGAGK